MVGREIFAECRIAKNVVDALATIELGVEADKSSFKGQFLPFIFCLFKGPLVDRMRSYLAEYSFCKGMSRVQPALAR